jgi:hypothetical protein
MIRFRTIHCIRRVAVLLTGLAGAILMSASVTPAAFAYIVPPSGGGPGTVKGPPLHPQAIASGGMAGWQITLIAVGAAVTAAVIAVILDRSRAARRHMTHATA